MTHGISRLGVGLAILGLAALMALRSSAVSRDQAGRREPGTVRLTAVGDVMMARGVERQCAQHGWHYPFESIAGALHDADLAMGNLECVLSHRPLHPVGPIGLRANPDCAPALKSAGFTQLNLANNHSMDCGPSGLADTLAALKSSGIQAVGGGDSIDEVQHGVVVIVHGVRVGLLGYTAFSDEAQPVSHRSPSVGALRGDELADAIRKLKSRCDVVVLNCHWGIEGRSKHVGQQTTIAHLAVDAGASLIIGHHPHVVEDVESYHGALIVYSLGNCVFDMNSGPRSSGAMLNCTLDRNGIKAWSLDQLAIHRCRPEIVPVMVGLPTR